MSTPSFGGASQDPQSCEWGRAAGLSAGKGETALGTSAFKSVWKREALEENPWMKTCAGL